MSDLADRLEAALGFIDHDHICDLMRGPQHNEPHCKCGMSKAGDEARESLAALRAQPEPSGADCERTILEEIASGHTQASVALTYAMSIRSSERKTINWLKVNTAIRKRWTGKTALGRVKRMAWRHYLDGRADVG